jgi:trigger factor
MNVGEEKVIKVKFPENYQAEKLAGENAEFAIKVNKIEEKQLPEVNDAFASNISEFETLEAYKANVKEKLEKELDEKVEREVENKLIEKIVKGCKLDIPSVLVERQLDAYIKDLESRVSYQGLKLDDYFKYTGTTLEGFRENKKSVAEDAVRTRLVLETIVTKESLFVTPGELNAKLEEVAKKYNNTLEEYKKKLGDKFISYFENDILMEKLWKFLKENNNII